MRFSRILSGIFFGCVALSISAGELTNEEKRIKRMIVESTNELEQDILRQGGTFNDPELKAYLERIIKQVFPDRADELRVYVAKDPSPNAFMWPNGMTMVTAGWFALMRNEAQIVYVMGHEGSHYFENDAISRYRSFKEMGEQYHKLNRNQWHGMNRDHNRYGQERELLGDRVGIKGLIDGGYSLNAAATAFPIMLELKKAFWDESDNGEFIEVISTHPGEKERFEQFQEVAREFGVRGEGKTAQEAYFTVTENVDRYVMQTWINRQRDEILRIMLGAPSAAKRYGKWYEYYVAELFRLSDDKEDDKKILPLLLRAEEKLPDEAEVKLALGRAYLAAGNSTFGKLYLQQFIQFANAGDPRVSAARILVADDMNTIKSSYSALDNNVETVIQSDLRQDYSYKASLPRDWHVEEPERRNGFYASTDGSSLNFLAMTHDDPKETYKSFKRAAPENFTVMDMADLTLRYITALHGSSNLEFLSSRVMDVDGETGIEVEYEYMTGNGIRYREVVTSVFHKGRIFDFQYRAPVRVYFDREKPVFDHMMATFRF